jgi:3-oxoacyl-[acyl-carrier protein] reductase
LTVSRAQLDRGWSVIGVSRRRTEEVSALEATSGGRYRFFEADLSEPGAIGTVVERAGVLEGLDGFVANAAVGLDGMLTMTAEADLRRCVELNLVAPMLLAREVIKGMLAAGRAGSLVFVSSVAARTGFTGLSVYGATKGGLVAFARSLAREYGERGIRANSVLPGFLATEMTAGLDQGRRSAIVRRTALKRLGETGDVAGAVAFLLSDEASYVTGTEIVIDGGMTA